MAIEPVGTARESREETHPRASSRAHFELQAGAARQTPVYRFVASAMKSAARPERPPPDGRQIAADAANERGSGPGKMIEQRRRRRRAFSAGSQLPAQVGASTSPRRRLRQRCDVRDTTLRHVVSERTHLIRREFEVYEIQSFT